MALRILGTTTTVKTPPAPPPPMLVAATTQYGQLACAICKREPPIAPGVVCYKCKHAAPEVDIMATLAGA